MDEPAPVELRDVGELGAAPVELPEMYSIARAVRASVLSNPHITREHRAANGAYYCKPQAHNYALNCDAFRLLCFAHVITPAPSGAR